MTDIEIKKSKQREKNIVIKFYFWKYIFEEIQRKINVL